jgi:hypothetical protein
MKLKRWLVTAIAIFALGCGGDTESESVEGTGQLVDEAGESAEEVAEADGAVEEVEAQCTFGDPCDDGDDCTTSEYCQEDGSCSIFGDGKSGTELCLFDVESQGKDLGNHVKNFGMKTHEGCPYWMHQNCGGDKKVIWMILSTGW